MYKILVCDDDRDIVNALNIYLTAEGYETVPCCSGAEAVRLSAENDIQLAVVDIMMPGMDGLQTLSKLREKSNFPVILLTAKSEDSDKVLGLTVGADDYVTKPFNPVELLARVKSQLRRYTLLGSMEKKETLLSNGGVSLDDEKKRVTVDGEEIALTPTEYSILKLLLANAGKVLSSAEIYRAVWNEAAIGMENTVAVHIRHLREKIEINPAEPRYITVVWGHGYKMQQQEEGKPL